MMMVIIIIIIRDADGMENDKRGKQRDWEAKNMDALRCIEERGGGMREMRIRGMGW